MLKKSTHVALLGSMLLLPLPLLPGQTAAPATSAVPHGSGTVKSTEASAFVLTNAAGQDVTVAVKAGTPVLLVQPGSHDLKSAQPGTLADIAPGDRTIVNGTAGDSAASLNATRVIVMKSSAIAATRATEQAAWAQGVGGIVRSEDPASGVITLSSGMRTVTVDTTPATSVKRYAGASVRFEDAVPSTVAAIRVGDQLRVRGAKSADGATITADAIVAGSFSNFSGLLTAVDPAADTVTLKDLATRRTVTVAVTPESNLRRMPAGAAQGAGARATSGGGEGAGGEHAASAGSPSGAGMHSGGGTRGGAAGADLSRMIAHLPTETLAGLKPGDAVMIVASNGNAQPTAITLLVGVEGILAAHPSGETTLSPWTIGGGGEAAEGGGAPQ